MTLRLSSHATSGVNDYIDRLSKDGSLSLDQRADCLKTLSVILRNLIDPTKGGGSSSSTTSENDSIKYRTLKLDNVKLKQRLFCVPYIQDMLLSRMVGFQYLDNDDNNNRLLTLVMPNPPSAHTVETLIDHLLPAIDRAQQYISVQKMEEVVESQKNHKLVHSTTDSSSTPVSAARTMMVDTSRMTEKQKARLIMEEKAKQDKERAKEARKLTQAQIAADKKVRMEDGNWKPSVSAAAAKTGTGMILTFRDRHGE